MLGCQPKRNVPTPTGVKLTVIVEGSHPSGNGRLHRIGRASVHFANHTCPSHRKADFVNSALPLRFFEVGIFGTSCKKIGKCLSVGVQVLAGEVHS